MNPHGKFILSSLRLICGTTKIVKTKSSVKPQQIDHLQKKLQSTLQCPMSLYMGPPKQEKERQREKEYTQFGRFFFTSYKARIASDASETPPNRHILRFPRSSVSLFFGKTPDASKLGLMGKNIAAMLRSTVRKAEPRSVEIDVPD